MEVLLKEESSYKRRSAMPCNDETSGEVFTQTFLDRVEEFLTDQGVQASWKFEDFGGQKLLAYHAEIIRVT